MYNIFTLLFIKDLTFDIMIWHYYLYGFTEVNELQSQAYDNDRIFINYENMLEVRTIV